MHIHPRRLYNSYRTFFFLRITVLLSYQSIIYQSDKDIRKTNERKNQQLKSVEKDV